MKPELIIIRYSEIALKGKETRKQFEKTLIKNIKHAFKKEDIENEIKKEWGRIYLYTNKINEAIEILTKIFGITSISPAIRTTDKIIDISKKAQELTKILNKKTSFALRVTRTGEHSYSSQDIAIEIGKDIQDKTNASVNLSKPDFELFIEIRNENTYLYLEKLSAPGGMPLGTQGKVLSIINNPEAILSSWYIARRGCMPVFLLEDKNQLKNLKKFCEIWHIKTKIIEKQEIKDFNDTISKIGISAIVTSHTLNDNEEDTIKQIQNLKQEINQPLLQPLIIFDKKTITKKAKEIEITL